MYRTKNFGDKYIQIIFYKYVINIYSLVIIVLLSYLQLKNVKKFLIFFKNDPVQF